MGSDADDLRDAAHEACHGFDCGEDNWERESVHRSLRKTYDNSGLLAAEFRARAVERMVCEHFEVKYNPEEWIFAASLETMRIFSGVPFNVWAPAIENAMETSECKELVERILNLGEDYVYEQE